MNYSTLFYKLTTSLGANIFQMNNSAFSEILHDFISLIYPDYCLACEDSLMKGEKLICTRCMVQMPQTNYHQEIMNPLRTRLSSRMELRYAMALFRFSKNGRVQRLLHALKYKNHPELGIELGAMYGERISTTLANAFDLIIPVPLHSSRKRIRGYNQSAKFAEGLSQSLGIFYSDNIIERMVKTETQTRKSKLNRWQNIAEVFRVIDPEIVMDKNILLVDDVVTTGSTLEACGEHLVKAGCASLSIACIAEA
jgi:ComF family protein